MDFADMILKPIDKFFDMAYKNNYLLIFLILLIIFGIYLIIR